MPRLKDPNQLNAAQEAALLRLHWMAAQAPDGTFPVRGSRLRDQLIGLGRRGLVDRVGDQPVRFALSPVGRARAEVLAARREVRS